MKETKFKQTEVGMIPWDWEVKCVDDCGTLKSGESPSNFTFVTSGIPYFKVDQMNNCNKYQIETPYFIAEKVFVPEGSILFPKRGAAIETNKVRILKQNSFFDTNVMSLTLDSSSICNEFFYYWLLKKELWKIADTTSVPQINNKHIKPLLFPCPNFEEQQRIANALSDVDTLIINLEKLIAKKKNIKQGAMQQLLTGRKRLPGFKEDWCEKQISKIGFTYTGLSGKTASDFNWGNALYVTFLNVLKNPIIDKHLFQKVNVCESENQNAVLKGDLLFNTSSEVPEEVGICSVLKDYIPNLYLNSFCFGFRLTDDEIEGLFLSYYFRSTLGRNLMSLLAQGSTRYNLSKDNFLKSKILMPSSKVEQTAIANVLSDMDSEIQTLETKLAKYRKLKTGMMQQLLTGKIRLV